MNFVKNVHCPVKWKCHRINEKIVVDPQAVYNVTYGWVCKCGHWVKQTTKEHDVELWGLRYGWK